MSLITDLIKTVPSELHDFQMDPSIICTKNHLKLVQNLRKKKKCVEFDNKSVPFIFLPVAENLEPGESIELIKSYTTRSPSWIPDSKVNVPLYQAYQQDSSKYDPYDEDSAEEKYLKSIPISFFILSKPNIGEVELAKMIAETFKCILITPESVLKDEIASDTRVGKCINFNLKNGRAIGPEVLLRLAQRRVQSQTARQRGYVIAGFPLIPNKEFKEDPLSSESAIFTVQEIFEEILPTTIPERPESASTIKGSKVSLEEEKEDVKGEEESLLEEAKEKLTKEEKNRKRKPTVKISDKDLGSDTATIIPETSATCLGSIEFQLQFLFSFFKEPYILIYLLCENLDVVNKISTYRFNLMTEKEESTLPELAKTDFTLDILTAYLGEPAEEVTDYKNLFQLPIHFNKSISAQLLEYKYKAMPIINEKLIYHDLQNFIRVDGRLPPIKIYNSVRPRLKCLIIQPVLIPQVLTEPEVEGEAEETTPFANLTLDEAYEKMRRLNIVSPMYKLQLSHFGYKCPVALKNGLIKLGQPDNAVQFMNKIYFLSDDEAVTNFCRNPRPFLLPVKPRPTYKIFIMGPRLAGKTDVALCLSYLFNCAYLDPDELLAEYRLKKKNEYMIQRRSAAITEGVTLLQKEREDERHQNIMTWLRSVIGLLKAEYPEISSMCSHPPSYLDVFESESTISSTSVVTHSEIINDLESLNIPLDDTGKIYEFFIDPEKLLEYLPEDLQKPIRAPTVYDSFITSYVDRILKNVAPEDYDLSLDEIVDMYQTAIENAENEYYEKTGWIIDGFPPNIDILKRLTPTEIPNEIICLKDFNPDYSFLQDKFTKRLPQVTDFQKFFKEAKKVSAARRAAVSSYPQVTTESRKTTRNKLDFVSKISDDEESLEEYVQSLKDFSEKWEALTSYLAQICPEPPIEIDVAKRTIEELFFEVILNVEKKYRRPAHEVTRDEENQEMIDFEGGGVTDDEGEAGEGAERPESKYQENRRLGNTNIYCPVTFAKHFVLWKGNEQYSARFEDKLYFMSSQRALLDFLKNPYDYVSDKPPESIPPPRIVIIGTIGTGKSTLGKSLARHFGLHYINFDEQLLDYLNLDTTRTLEEYLDKPETEETNIIRNYLNGEGLPTTIFNSLLVPLWKHKPFKRTGFVLDSYPRRIVDIEQMVGNVLIPDVVIVLNLDIRLIHDRIIPDKMKQWEIDMEQKKKDYQEECDKKIQEWELEYQMKVDDLFIEIKNERKQEYLRSLSPKPPQSSPVDSFTKISMESYEEEIEMDNFIYDPIQESEDIENVKTQILEKFPKPEFHYEWETYEEAYIKTENFINDLYTKYLEDLVFLEAKLKEENIDNILYNNKELFEKSVLQLSYMLEKYKFRNRSLFERVYPINVDVAEKLLEQGYYFLSKFGKTCPVQVYERKNPIQMYLQNEFKGTLCPVIHRRYIYFICGQNERDKFMNDPLKYTENTDCKFPLIPFRLAIRGPLKSGKSSLAEKIHKELGLKPITPGNACRYILKSLSYCELAHSMSRVLEKGWSLTEEMVAGAMQAATLDGKCIAQGYTLIGFPNSIGEMKYFEEADIIPHLVINTSALLPHIRGIVFEEHLTGKLVTYSFEFIKHRYAAWLKEQQAVKTYIHKRYQNIIDLHFTMNKWEQWTTTRNIIFSYLSDIVYYFMHKSLCLPFSLKALLITPEEFREKQGEFMHYCPCCLFYNKFLVHGGEPPDRTGLVQFRQYYYWICPEHFDEFMKSPIKFVPPDYENMLPDDIPIVTKQICYDFWQGGLCIVTFWENQPRRVIVDGKTEFKVFYKEKCYIFCSEECMQKFLKEPHKYFDKVIHFRDPLPLKLTETLPTLGYLEQHVAKLLIEALMATEEERPVHPGMDLSKSAIMYLALFLKCKNPKTRKEFVEKYEQFKAKYDERRKFIKESVKLARIAPSPRDNDEELIMDELKLTVLE